MHWGSPLIIELLPGLSVFFLLVSLPYEGVLEELRPWETLAGGLIKEALQEGFEFWGHVLWEFHWVLYYQMDECVDWVGVEGWGAHE